jgi:hypothetical protein
MADPASDEQTLAYRRETDHEGMTVVINFADVPNQVAVEHGFVVFSTLHPNREVEVTGSISLEPHEGVILSPMGPGPAGKQPPD